MEGEYLEGSMSPEMDDENSPDTDNEMNFPEEHDSHPLHPTEFSWRSDKSHFQQDFPAVPHWQLTNVTAAGAECSHKNSSLYQLEATIYCWPLFGSFG